MASGGVLYVRSSSDRGHTWGEPVLLSAAGGPSAARHALTVGPDGSVWAAWSQLGEAPSTQQLVLRRSRDRVYVDGADPRLPARCGARGRPGPRHDRRDVVRGIHRRRARHRARPGARSRRVTDGRSGRPPCDDEESYGHFPVLRWGARGCGGRRTGRAGHERRQRAVPCHQCRPGDSHGSRSRGGRTWRRTHRPGWRPSTVV